MTSRPHPAYILVIRLVAAAGFVLAAGHLLTRVLLPDGRLTVTSDFVRPAPYVELPKPSIRLLAPVLAADGTPRTPFLGDPIYVDVKPPSAFESVTVTLSYENEGNVAVELGALVSALDQQYDVRPLEHRVLDALPWKRMSSGTLSLYDREGVYASVDDFLRNPPGRNRVASYRAAVPIPYRLTDYVPAAEPREDTVSLRGHHRMYTYVKDEPLNLTLVVQDMNRQSGADPAVLSVFAEGSAADPVARTVLADDGNTRDDQKSSGLRQIPVTLLAPKEGVYRIEFIASDDVFIRSIITRQRKLVFAEAMYIGDHVGYSDKTAPVTVFTGADRLTARTAHAEAVQTLTFGTKPVALTEPNERVTATVPHAGLVAVTSPKRDVLLQVDGLFALTQDAWFDPLPLTMTNAVTSDDLDRRGIDFVLADYEPTRRDAGLATASATFDVSTLAKTEEGRYRFAVSVPDIYDTGHPFRAAKMTFAFRRPPLSFGAALSSLFDAFRPAAPEAVAEPTVLPNARWYGEQVP